MSDSLEKKVRAIFTPDWRRFLMASLQLREIDMQPPVTDKRRTKKQESLTNEEKRLRAEAILAFQWNDIDMIMPIIEDAFTRRDPTPFLMLARVAHELGTIPSETKKRVKCALEAEIRLLNKLERIPTKQEIQEESGMKMEPQRWTEIHKAAGQAKNPTGKPKRGQERRGGNGRKKLPLK
jgi:hypothetical protein